MTGHSCAAVPDYRRPPEVYLDADQIEQRISEMAAEINAVYRDSTRLIVIVVLKGAFIFAADLLRKIQVPCQVEFVRLASYGEARTSSGTIKPVDLSLPPLSGEEILVVEDILDTGLTLHFLMEYLQSLHHTRSLRLAVLLDKQEARRKDVQADFCGFTVSDGFFVGYGLDCAGYYRNLPFIGLLKD